MKFNDIRITSDAEKFLSKSLEQAISWLANNSKKDKRKTTMQDLAKHCHVEFGWYSNDEGFANISFKGIGYYWIIRTKQGKWQMSVYEILSNRLIRAYGDEFV